MLCLSLAYKTSYLYLFILDVYVLSNLQYSNKQKRRIQNDVTMRYVAIHLFFKHLLNSYHISGITLKTDI